MSSTHSPPPPPVFPPAPVTASIHASTARLKQNRALPDNLVLLRRQEKQIHDELQDLLWAQDEALRAATGAADDVDLSGSLTPTVQSLAGKKTSERPQPRRKLGVRAARKGIRNAMRQLAAVKDEERRLLDQDKASNSAVLEKLTGWEEHQQALEKQIREIEAGDEGSRTDALREEAHVLEGEIHELEQKLAVTKARHRRLISEISEIDNSVQSKLSSYKASLSILESDIKTFLRSTSAHDRASSETLFFQIPPKRRTLGLAKEHWLEELSGIENKQQETKTEREALEEGAITWSEIVRKIADFEKHIAETLHREPSGDPTAEAKELIAHLDETMHYVEMQLDQAEERGWKLLVACIGAELSALQQGRNMLEMMVQSVEGTSPTVEREKQLGDVDVQFQPSSLANSTNVNGDVSAGQTSLPVRQPRRDYQSTDEDEPDPELLISHQDTDDE